MTARISGFSKSFLHDLVISPKTLSDSIFKREIEPAGSESTLKSESCYESRSFSLQSVLYNTFGICGKLADSRAWCLKPEPSASRLAATAALRVARAPPSGRPAAGRRLGDSAGVPASPGPGPGPCPGPRLGPRPGPRPGTGRVARFE